jgi:hypothetical protein
MEAKGFARVLNTGNLILFFVFIRVIRAIRGNSYLKFPLNSSLNLMYSGIDTIRT